MKNKDANAFDGEITEVFFYKKTLTAAEIDKLRKVPKPKAIRVVRL